MLKIGIIDSGIGGFSVLKGLVDSEVSAEYYYVYDNKYHPYGNKSQSELVSICYKNMCTLYDLGVDMVILACNTLTTCCVQSMRNMFDIPIIGVEPPIKPCIAECSRVIVLATTWTIQSPRMRYLTIKYPDVDFYYPKACDLASLIENNIYGDKNIITEYLHTVLDNLGFCDGLVVGCTHYNFVLDILSEILPNTKIFTSTSGVVNRVKSLINSKFDNGESVVNILPTGGEFEERKLSFIKDYIGINVTIQ